EFIDHLAQLRHHVAHFRTVGGVERRQLLMRWATGDKIRIPRIVAKLLVLDQVPHYIDPEPVDAAPEPEAHHVVDGLAHLRIAPVQVGLLLEEGVVVVLAGYAVDTTGPAD